ncbi:uncharacterized protein sS8_4341 [Methylocaldum marinum]|uniref:EF-hand domain-containing protein n=1 Tax=Methylocaldum marinum TaxID=1432792 RepID=A0A250KZ58_9GAMM|nr:EF-hand domain-containing protein [Methylocaldum marinum]BBA36271.1 uncharacterized protein sS8_4341 [Methylocaldum marinum]
MKSSIILAILALSGASLAAAEQQQVPGTSSPDTATEKSLDVTKQPAEPPAQLPPGQQIEKGIPASPHQVQVEKEIKSKRFKKLDANGDGLLSEDEGRADSKLMEQWQELDSNRDGQLDEDEFSKFEQNVPAD